MMTRRGRMLKDLDQQIRDHIEEETQDNIGRGLSPKEARYAALRKFGSVMIAKEDARGVWVSRTLDQLLQDIRLGCRIVTKSPALTATAVLLVALVIGGNTTVFSIAHGILKKPAPGVTSAGLVRLNWIDDKGRVGPASSYPNYQDLVGQSTTLRPMLASLPFGRFTLSHEHGSYAVNGSLVSQNYFDTLGVQLVKGRTFTEEELQAAASGMAVVISHRAWQDLFQGAEDVFGRSVFLNGHPATIVGVAAPAFRGMLLAEAADVWVPVVSFARASGQERSLLSRSDYSVAMTGRLAPGASLAQATAEITAIWAGLQASHPELKHLLRVTLVPYSAVAGSGMGIARMGDRLLAILTVVTILTLVIVCANVANLLIARAVIRQREIALRQSLGASRVRIIRMLLAEGLVISCLAAAAAFLCAWWVAKATTGFVAPGPWSAVAMMDFTPDWTVAGYAVVLAIVAVVAFTVAPAIRMWRLDLLPALKAGEPGVVRGRSRLSSGLVIVQLAFSVLLLTSAGLAYRSLSLMATRDPGFNMRNLLLVTVNTAGNATSADTNALLLDTLRERLRGVSGVEHVTYARLPLFREGGGESTASGSPDHPQSRCEPRATTWAPTSFACSVFHQSSVGNSHLRSVSA